MFQVLLVTINVIILKFEKVQRHTFSAFTVIIQNFTLMLANSN